MRSPSALESSAWCWGAAGGTYTITLAKGAANLGVLVAIRGAAINVGATAVWQQISTTSFAVVTADETFAEAPLPFFFVVYGSN